MGLFALTFGLVVACRDDGSERPPRAHAVPNESVTPLPITAPSDDDDITADDATAPRLTELTIAVEVDPSVIVDTWTIRVTADGQPLADEVYSGESQHERLLQFPAGSTVPVEIEIFGTTKLSDGTSYVSGRRVATAKLAPSQHQLAYLYVDGGCVYSSHTEGCEDPHQWCYEGQCRAEELALEPYHEDWKTHAPSPCGSNLPDVHLGEGFDLYSERANGDTVTIECGPQGGHHLWLGVRTTGLDQRAPIVTIRAPATDAGAPLITASTGARLYQAAPAMDGGTAPLPGYCELKGILFQLDPDGRSVLPYLGQPLDVTVEVQDRGGRKATVTRRLQIANKLSSTSCFAP